MLITLRNIISLIFLLKQNISALNYKKDERLRTEETVFNLSYLLVLDKLLDDNKAKQRYSKRNN